MSYSLALKKTDMIVSDLNKCQEAVGGCVFTSDSGLVLKGGTNADTGQDYRRYSGRSLSNGGGKIKL